MEKQKNTKFTRSLRNVAKIFCNSYFADLDVIGNPDDMIQDAYKVKIQKSKTKLKRPHQCWIVENQLTKLRIRESQ